MITWGEAALHDVPVRASSSMGKLDVLWQLNLWKPEAYAPKT
jgi:hypothetical protein